MIVITSNIASTSADFEIQEEGCSQDNLEMSTTVDRKILHQLIDGSSHYVIIYIYIYTYKRFQPSKVVQVFFHPD